MSSDVAVNLLIFVRILYRRDELMETVEIKSKRFAVRIARMVDYLRKEKKEFIITNQVLRSGTSIGANISEAQSSPSKKDFLAKMYIAFKECGETLFWLETLYKSGILTDMEYKSINHDCIEIRKMLSAITKTTKQNLEKESKKMK